MGSHDDADAIEAAMHLHDQDVEIATSDNNQDADPFDDPEEKQVLYKAVNSFHRYQDQAHYHITHKRRQAFYALPQKHSSMLSSPPFSMLETFDRIDDAIDTNAVLARAIVANGVDMFGLEPPSSDTQYDHAFNTKSSARAAWEGPVNPVDQEKAHSTVKQFYRDWSAEGAAERRACIGPVIAALDHEYQHIPRSQRGDVKVLVPGAGLGRSVFEVARAGYGVEGNEISYHQIIASSFILNRSTHAGQFELYPWIASFSNHLSREDHLQMVRIPDVHPLTEWSNAAEVSDTHPCERMGFSSADFCVAYKDEDSRESFDAVASIFFIDTAPNVIKYVEAVHHCVKTGGIWINIGPLKWHFENSAPGAGDDKNIKKPSPDKASMDTGIGEPGSIELTEDEVMALLDTMGFTVEQHKTKQISTGYIGNPNSMWESVYHPSFWVARKR